MNAEAITQPAENLAEKRAKKAAAERERRAAKKTAAANAETNGTPEVAAAPEYAVVVIDGQSIQVSASLPPGEQQNVARRIHSAAQERKTENASPKPRGTRNASPKPGRTARNASSKLPEGHVKFPLSTSAYSVLVASELDEKIIKALKASDKIRSATKAKNLPYHFPVMTREQASECADVLAATAKAWEKMASKDRPGNLASIQRYAKALREAAKA